MERKIKQSMLVLVVAVTMISITGSVKAATGGWIFNADITEIASKGEGSKFIRVNSSVNDYKAGTPVYFYSDVSDPKINDPKHIKDFWAQVLLAYSLKRKISIEVFQRTILEDGKPITAWVAQSLMLKP